MVGYKDVSIEEAKAHELYGVGGWLLLLWIMTFFGVLWSISIIFVPSVASAYGEMGVDPSFFWINSAIGLMSYGPFLVFSVTKHPKMPTYSSYAVFLGFLVGTITSLIMVPFELLGMGTVLNLAMVFSIVQYLKHSKRIQVTYSQRIPLVD